MRTAREVTPKGENFRVGVIANRKDDGNALDTSDVMNGQLRTLDVKVKNRDLSVNLAGAGRATPAFNQPHEIKGRICNRVHEITRAIQRHRRSVNQCATWVQETIFHDVTPHAVLRRK